MSYSPYHDYSHACDANGKLVNVSSAKRGLEYFCPECQATMVVHKGKKRRWHFEHKSNIKNCSYETYLHKIAKIKIREAFLNSPSFIISYNIPILCQRKDSCIFFRHMNCIDSIIVNHDIRKYYDKCDEEVIYKNFKADLILYSSIKPEREPVLLEIYVSHKSTIKKVTSGIRIIEVRIKNEEDIDSIVSNLKIIGYQNFLTDTYPHVTERNYFFNFKGQLLKEPSYFNKNGQNLIHYMWLNKLGDFKISNCLCDDNPMKYIPEDTHYYISSHPFNCAYAFFEFIKKGISVKNCLLCKNARGTIMSGANVYCAYYHQFGGIPASSANKCNLYVMKKEKDIYTMSNLSISDKCKTLVGKCKVFIG